MISFVSSLQNLRSLLGNHALLVKKAAAYAEILQLLQGASELSHTKNKACQAEILLAAELAKSLGLAIWQTAAGKKQAVLSEADSAIQDRQIVRALTLEVCGSVQQVKQSRERFYPAFDLKSEASSVVSSSTFILFSPDILAVCSYVRLL